MRPLVIIFVGLVALPGLLSATDDVFADKGNAKDKEIIGDNDDDVKIKNNNNLFIVSSGIDDDDDDHDSDNDNYNDNMLLGPAFATDANNKGNAIIIKDTNNKKKNDIGIASDGNVNNDNDNNMVLPDLVSFMDRAFTGEDDTTTNKYTIDDRNNANAMISAGNNANSHTTNSNNGDEGDGGGSNSQFSINNNKKDSNGKTNVPVEPHTTAFQEVLLESKLRILADDHTYYQKRVTLLKGSPKQLATILVFDSDATTSYVAKPTEIITLSYETRVRSTSWTTFSLTNSEGNWKFMASTRAERNKLIEALEQEIDRQYDPTNLKKKLSEEYTIMAKQTFFSGMQRRAVKISGSTLLVSCKVRRDGTPRRPCEELLLDDESFAAKIPFDKRRVKRDNFFFRVTTDKSPSAKSWTFDAGSRQGREMWVSYINNRKKSKHAGTPLRATSTPSVDRGSTLGPRDPPLEVGQYLTDKHHRLKLEISELGDITLTRTGNDEIKEPTWAYRAPTTWGDRADGGLGCMTERLLRKVVGKEEIPMTLKVRNGRWRIGRGPLCTLGRSPRPDRSLRRRLRNDSGGKALRKGFLVVSNNKVVIESESDVIWDSSVD